MFPEGHPGLTKGPPPGGSKTPPTSRVPARAIVREPHPAIRSVLEYLLSREGYSVEVAAETDAGPGPALVLASAGEGLYVFACGDATEALRWASAEARLEGFAGATGIRAFLPKPFGADDVLRVVRAVDGFDGRRRAPGGHGDRKRRERGSHA